MVSAETEERLCDDGDGGRELLAITLWPEQRGMMGRSSDLIDAHKNRSGEHSVRAVRKGSE
jgi:hypothetical protein